MVLFKGIFSRQWYAMAFGVSKVGVQGETFSALSSVQGNFSLLFCRYFPFVMKSDCRLSRKYRSKLLHYRKAYIRFDVNSETPLILIIIYLHPFLPEFVGQPHKRIGKASAYLSFVIITTGKLLCFSL